MEWTIPAFAFPAEVGTHLRPWRDGRLSWPRVAGWLHTEIDVRHRELNPHTVAHLSTNRARRRLTLLIEANVLTRAPFGSSELNNCTYLRVNFSPSSSPCICPWVKLDYTLSVTVLCIFIATVFVIGRQLGKFSLPFVRLDTRYCIKNATDLKKIFGVLFFICANMVTLIRIDNIAISVYGELQCHHGIVTIPCWLNRPCMS